ncbi:MAG: helix-turn-helix domain-containing protein [Bacteroidota bacterium]
MKKATKPHSPPSPDRHLPPLKATKSSTVGHVAFYQWIEEGEHDRQDFKETISSSRKIAKTLCAFANTRGGRLLVGVRDNGSLRHLDTEAEKQMLENAGSFFCKPEVALDFTRSKSA